MSQSVVVNVMLSLMSLLIPPPSLYNLSVRTVDEVMYVWRVCFRIEFGFLHCDDISMCVVNMQFELPEPDKLVWG